MASVPTFVCSRSCKDSSPPNLFVSRLLVGGFWTAEDEVSCGFTLSTSAPVVGESGGLGSNDGVI